MQIMGYQFKRGDRLILELLNCDILEGEYVDGTKDKIILVNIVWNDCDNVPGPFTYYRTEISAVRLLSETQSNNSNGELHNSDIHNSPQKGILLGKTQYEKLKAMSHNPVYMTMMDSRYYKAMDHIKTCESIGIAGITTSFELPTKLSIIVIATLNEVYIIDYLTFNTSDFPQELKDILESKYIKKVLHDSRLFTEVLAKRFKVKLENIFDTKLADVVIRKRKGESPETTKSLSECLVHYFNFPASLVSPEETNLNKWTKRPISDNSKHKAAQLVAFLITLRDHMEQLLNEDFYKAVSDYSRSLQHCCVIEVPDRLRDKKLCDTLQNMKVK